ncbi:glycosyltransferase [Psychrobacter sp. FBL11]|uniref:Glycosyltransferase n=1 Tax=Psychrobacter saeujeotis TaxID=3143436 RepID=A0ABU9X8U9_9GAMM|nr:glycosyltransferase [uncultured Psychrobacter sp.]
MRKLKKLKRLFDSNKTKWTTVVLNKYNYNINADESVAATRSIEVENSSLEKNKIVKTIDKRTELGLLIYKDAIELSLTHPVWYELPVQAGQTLVIKAASQYLNLENITDRKAVLMINSYDENGKEVDIPCGQMAKSENLHAYFKYLPSTNNSIKELHSFVVPDGVSQIHLGLSAFNTFEMQKIFVKSLSIKQDFKDYHTDKPNGLDVTNEVLEPSIFPTSGTVNDEQLSQKTSATGKVEFGLPIHNDSIELSEKTPFWYQVSVQAGQRLAVSAASQYQNIEETANRKAVLMINSYGDDGEYIDSSCGQMGKSEILGAYFKYLPFTNNIIREVHSFVVPDGVSQIHLGFCAFNTVKEQKVFVKNLSIEPKLKTLQDTNIINLTTAKKKLESTTEQANDQKYSALNDRKLENGISSKRTDIKKSQFGLLIYKDAIELPKESSIWYELPVKAGQVLIISAASQYLNMKNIVDRKAVLMINSYDEDGEEVDIPCGRMAKSSVLNAYFKYLPFTNNDIKELHSFVVPDGVSQIHLGLCAFNTSKEQKVFVKNLSIEPKLAKSQATKFIAPSVQAAEVSIIGWPEIPVNNKPCIIGVMDEFTTGCFEQDVNLIQPRPDNWLALAEKYKPVLFFIESAWQGNYGSWQYRVGQYANKPGHEIDHICQYARNKGIPTLFWNKEDPVHHDKFMCSAKLVDYIYTTDANMKSSYIKKTGNTNIHSLPFAAQPALHKPASLQGRKPRSCFAGSWYGNRHAERGEAMSWLLKAANNYGLDIYDRNYDNGTFPFPEEYQAGIKGSLPYKELCEEYNRYRIFLNVNSVTESPTMFSRRVFELMASGTPVVSTYAKGIETLFDSDAVWLVNNQEEADIAIRTLMTDDAEWRRRSLAGIREIFSKHTYAHRLNGIFADMNIGCHITIDSNIALFAKANSLVEINLLEQFAKNQSYRNFCLVIEYAQNKISIENKVAENIIIIESNESKAWAIENQDSYPIAGWVTPNNYYGKYYLRDLINASIYEPKAEGWAKALENDVFGYGAPTLLSGALWKMKEFLNYYIDAKADDSITYSKLYLADSEQFEGNIDSEYKQLRGAK